MAILTQVTQRSAYAVHPASQAALSMSFEAARAQSALACLGSALPHPTDLPAAPGVLPVSHKSTDLTVLGNVRMRGDVDGGVADGPSAISAFVTRLGSRPPSPPV